MAEHDFTHSTLRERIIEHIFLGNLLKILWKRGITNVEVLRPEFDSQGYDLVLTCGSVTRHIQLKTKTGKGNKVSVSRALANKASGCVIWIVVDGQTLELGPFLWYGGDVGKPLPDISNCPVTRRTTPNASGKKPVRENHRDLRKSSFRTLSDMEELVALLLGQESEFLI